MALRWSRSCHGGFTCVIAAGLILGGCAQGSFSTQSQRIAYDDPADTCRPQVVALDSTGNFFGPQILTGAAIGAGVGALSGGLISGDWGGALIGAGAGAVLGGSVAYWSALQQQQMDQAQLYTRVSGDLVRENGQIDRTQLAYDQLVDCRFRQAANVRETYRARQIDRAQAQSQMAVIRQRAAGDQQLARMINQQIQDRGQQFAVATENLGPGAPPPTPPPSRTVTVRRAAPLKLTPDPNAPAIGQLAAHQHVSVTGGRNGYALVQTPNGERGYAAVDDLNGSGARSVSVASTAAQPAAGGSVRTLAGSNAARRDDFAQSVAVTEQAQTSGFELTG